MSRHCSLDHCWRLKSSQIITVGKCISDSDRQNIMLDRVGRIMNVDSFIGTHALVMLRHRHSALKFGFHAIFMIFLYCGLYAFINLFGFSAT